MTVTHPPHLLLNGPPKGAGTSALIWATWPYSVRSIEGMAVLSETTVDGAGTAKTRAFAEPKPGMSRQINPFARWRIVLEKPSRCILATTQKRWRAIELFPRGRRPGGAIVALSDRG